MKKGRQLRPGDPTLDRYYGLEESILTSVRLARLQSEVELVVWCYHDRLRGFPDNLCVRLQFTDVQMVSFSRIAVLPGETRARYVPSELATWGWNEIDHVEFLEDSEALRLLGDAAVPMSHIVVALGAARRAEVVYGTLTVMEEECALQEAAMAESMFTD
ncbi:hypothetical protein BH20CHL6_BH20CHL6_14650 [soil metagenome]